MREIETVDDAVAVLRRHGITTGTQYDALRKAAASPPAPVKIDYTREELIAICADAVVPHDRWCNRDSASAQYKVGLGWVLLSAGCDFQILQNPGGCNTDAETIWLEIYYRGFNDFEDGEGPTYDETVYLPTRKRLQDNVGGDWY
jgi:hypothetical protein